MNKENRNLAISIFVMAAVLIMTASMLAAIFFLKSRADAGHDSEEMAQAIVANSHALNSLEWKAIASKKMEAGITVEIEERRVEIDEALDFLEQQSGDETMLTSMRQNFDNYVEATDEEFLLISSGRIPEALVIDEEEVDPLFEQLVKTAAEISTTNRARAASDSNISYYLISLICLLTIVITGILLWLYSRVIRRSS